MCGAITLVSSNKNASRKIFAKTYNKHGPKRAHHRNNHILPHHSFKLAPLRSLVQVPENRRVRRHLLTHIVVRSHNVDGDRQHVLGSEHLVLKVELYFPCFGDVELASVFATAFFIQFVEFTQGLGRDLHFEEENEFQLVDDGLLVGGGPLRLQGLSILGGCCYVRVRCLSLIFAVDKPERRLDGWYLLSEGPDSRAGSDWRSLSLWANSSREMPSALTCWGDGRIINEV